MKNDFAPDSLTDTADQADLLHTAADPQPADGRAGATADAQAGNEGGENGAQVDGVAAPAKSAARPVSGENKSTKGVFGKLSRLLGGGEAVRCTCGRAGSGKQGRHAKTCPVSVSSGGAAPKHFGAVDLADADAHEAGNLFPVSQVPVVPPDYSLWGRLAKTAVELVERAAKKAAYYKCKKVLDADTARECADELSIDEKEIKSFAESATRCAEHYKKNPQHAPLVDLGLQGGMISVSLWTGFDRLDERLKKIQSAHDRVARNASAPAEKSAENVVSLAPLLMSTRQPD